MQKWKSKTSIATITLDDGKANALGFTMIEHINKALDEAEAGADVIVMTGREGVMTAGFDLKVMRNEPERVMDLVTQGGQLLVRIFASPKPVLLASTGHGIAAGALLMLAGDYRISMAGDFKYGLNESAIGMVLPPLASILRALSSIRNISTWPPLVPIFMTPKWRVILAIRMKWSRPTNSRPVCAKRQNISKRSTPKRMPAINALSAKRLLKKWRLI